MSPSLETSADSGNGNLYSEPGTDLSAGKLSSDRQSAMEKLDGSTREELLGRVRRSASYDLEQTSTVSPGHIETALNNATSVDIEIEDRRSIRINFLTGPKEEYNYYSLSLWMSNDLDTPVTCRYDSHESTSDRYLYAAADAGRLVTFLEEKFADNAELGKFLVRYRDMLNENTAFKTIAADPTTTDAQLIGALVHLSEKVLANNSPSETIVPRVYLNNADRHGRYFSDGGGLGTDTHPEIPAAFGSYRRICVDAALAQWTGGPANVDKLFKLVTDSGFTPVSREEALLIGLMKRGGVDFDILPAGNLDKTRSVDPGHIVVVADVLGKTGKEQLLYKIPVPAGTITVPKDYSLNDILGKSLATKILYGNYQGE